jgi:hypothetical protein
MTSQASPSSGATGPSAWTIALWTAFGLALASIAYGVARFDFRSNPVAGDQASFVMQSASLAFDHDLAYTRRDARRWRRLGWTANPSGLFYQRNRDGFALGKPYGFSLATAPFVRVLGLVRGIPVAQLAIFGVLLAASAAILRTRYRGATIPLLLGAFYLASYPYLYLYVVHAELFLAMLVAVFWLLILTFVRTRREPILYLAVGVGAFLIAEKLWFTTLVAPICAVVVWEERKRAAVKALAVMAAALLLSVGPYLYYSDFRAFTPYGGASRYYASWAGGAVAFDPASPPLNLQRTYTDRMLTPGWLARTMSDPARLRQVPPSIAYYFLGGHTGLIVFIPIAALLVAAAWVLVRRLDRYGLAVLAGLTACVTGYVLLFPTNYYGGGQSIGNRYFVQFAPTVLALATLVPLRDRIVQAFCGFSIVLSVLFLWPHHRSPQNAFLRPDRTSALQRIMPLETNQEYVGFFVCGRPVCDEPGGR